MNRWNCIERNGYGTDVEYRSNLLATLGIDDGDCNVDELIMEGVDALYTEIGPRFKACLTALRSSPSRAQYLMLYGANPSDADLFVFLLSFDTFFHFSKCVDEIAASQRINEKTMEPLLRICSR